jgi:hypothetical protein
LVYFYRRQGRFLFFTGGNRENGGRGKRKYFVVVWRKVSGGSVRG